MEFLGLSTTAKANTLPTNARLDLIAMAEFGSGNYPITESDKTAAADEEMSLHEPAGLSRTNHSLLLAASVTRLAGHTASESVTARFHLDHLINFLTVRQVEGAGLAYDPTEGEGSFLAAVDITDNVLDSAIRNEDTATSHAMCLVNALVTGLRPEVLTGRIKADHPV